MAICDFRGQILSELKERNSKENSFSELIYYSNQLLESLDYLKKESINRKVLSNKFESNVPQSPPADLSSIKSEEIGMLVNCCNLQKELADCHKKISEYAQQVLKFRNDLDEKNRLFSLQKKDLDSAKIALSDSQDLCDNLVRQISELKCALQNKADELDTLNITYSSLEGKKNDLEIENKNLRSQLSALHPTKPVLVAKESENKIAQNVIPEYFQSEANISLSTKMSSSENVAVSNEVPENIKYEFNAHDSQVNAVLWMSSLHLITGGADRKVKLWELSDAGVTLKKCVRDSNAAVMSIDLDSDANLLLCASCDFASRVWTASDFRIRHTLTGHSGKVFSAKFLNENNQIVSGSSDQTLKLWDLRRRVCLHTCSTNSPVNDVINAGGQCIISGHADKKIKLWDARSNSETAQIMCSGPITSLDLTKNGFTLLACQKDDKLTLIDLRKNHTLLSLSSDGFEVGCDWTQAKFSPDNKHCSCGSKNGSIFTWILSTGKVKNELKGHKGAVVACGWSPCGSYFTTCDSDRKCIIWSNL